MGAPLRKKTIPDPKNSCRVGTGVIKFFLPL
jgi:hypothetical protein